MFFLKHSGFEKILANQSLNFWEAAACHNASRVHARQSALAPGTLVFPESLFPSYSAIERLLDPCGEP